MYAYVGCRTTKERGARGSGISVYRVEDGGGWTLIDVVGGLINPSYLAFDHGQRFLYAVHGDQHEASAFAIDTTTGRLKHLNTVECGGRNPVHLVPTHDDTHMIVANFATGTIGVLPRALDGRLGAPVHVAHVTGTVGPRADQQKGAHPHQIVWAPGTSTIVVPDKGVDQISLFGFDAARLRLDALPAIAARPAAAPRHLAFHPTGRWAYLANELDSTIAAYRWDAQQRTFTLMQLLPTVSDEARANNTTAGILVSPSGRLVAISNRGDDTIALYAIDQETGRMTLRQSTPTRGTQPRFITLSPDGRLLYVANETSDSIVAFAINEDDERLEPTGLEISTPSPTCIVFGT